jgi:hypothetical protein
MKKILPVIFFLVIVSIFITNKFNKSKKETILFLGETKFLSKINSKEFPNYNVKYFLYDDINYNNLIKNIKNNDYYILKEKNIYLNQLISSANYIVINLNNKKLTDKCNNHKQFNNYISSKQEEKNNLVSLINRISHSKIIIAEYDCNQYIGKNQNYYRILLKNDIESNIKLIKDSIK